MTAIQTTFLEIDYETPEAARTARDGQATQLEAQGVSFRCETLYRATDGRCVFVITIQDTEEVQEAIAPASRRDRTSGTRRDRTHKPRRPRTNSQPVEYR